MLLLGCSPAPRSYSRILTLDASQQCRSLLTEMQHRITDEGVSSAFGHPLYGYPYLRSNRFLASFRMELHSEQRQQEWWRRLWQLGFQVRQQQLDNLNVPFSVVERETIETCIQQLAEIDRQRPDSFEQMQRQARVPSGYNWGARIAGLYPLTRLPVLRVISSEQATWHQAFNNPLFIQGEHRTYRPAGTGSLTDIKPSLVAAWLEQGRGRSALGIPELSEQQLQQLFEYFAPSWRLYYQSDADQIGAISITDGSIQVDSQNPVSYVMHSYTRFQGEVLLQLNYQIWFPQRAAETKHDPYSGYLDGLLWRLTLASDGEVLSYDSIHPCGCYHKLYPVSKRTEVRTQVEAERVYQEQPLILQRQVPNPYASRIQVHLNPGNHYVVGLSPYLPSNDEQSLPMLSFHSLNSLPSTSGHQSLYSRTGMVPESMRSERYFLWPMGVPSAGAMRQWGNHLISFTGNRHFDDPFLMDSFLEYH